MSFLIASGELLAQDPGWDDSVYGWYETPDERSVLVSPGPKGGYRALDFADTEFSAFEFGPGANEYRFVAPSEGGPALVAPGARRWTPIAVPPYDLRPAAFAAPDGVVLRGLMLRPTEPNGRGAVMLHGSGDSDRDNVWAYTFAHELAVAGVTVLFPDKRGSGDSGGNWRSAGLDALARDGAAGLSYLVDELGALRADCTGWVGLSQGGWVAPSASLASGRGAFLVGVSSAAVPPFDQVAFEVGNTLRAEGLPPEAVRAAMRLLTSFRQRATGHATWAEYSARRDSLLDGPAAAFVETMPADSLDWRWGWWARTGNLDPVELWARAALPVLVVYGESDEADNVPVTESVARLDRLARRPVVGAQISSAVIPGVGHALIDPASEWVATEALERIVEFVNDIPCAAAR